MKKYLQKLLWKYALRLTSAFNTPSLLKSRIVMLYQKPSARVAVAKFGFILPTLMLCMLITAFTQRERILPKILAMEVNKVAQRLATEMQNAFLPAIVEKQEIVQFKQEIQKGTLEKLPSEKLEVEKEVNTYTPIQKIEVINRLALKDLGTVFYLKDTVKGERKYSKSLQKSMQKLDDMLPFRIDNYRYLKQLPLNNSGTIETNLVLEKDKEHLIRFCDKNVRTRNTKAIEVQADIEITQNGVAIPIKKTDKGFEFTPTQYRTYKIVAKNLPKNKDLTMVLYEYNPEDLHPYVTLLDEKNEQVKSRRAKNSGINLNQTFQLVFTQTGKFTDLQIHEVLITVRNKEKGVTFERVVTSPSFNLADLPVKKGDWIVLLITELSGKINGETTKNIKNKGLLSEGVFTFSINPKIN